MGRNTSGSALQWRHNGRYGVSNHRRFDCLPNRLFRRRSMKTSKHRRYWPLWRVFTGEFHAQTASNAEKYFSNWQLFIHFNIWVQLVLNYHIYAVVILMVISKWKPPQLINSSQLQKDFLRGGDFIIISVDVSLTPQAVTLMAWGPFYQHSPPPPPDKMATVSQTIF